MSRKKRKLSFVRLLLVLLIAAALVACLFFGIKFAIKKIENKTSTTNTPTVQKEPLPNTDTNEEVKIEVVDYTIYKDEENELGFNFIVANLKFTSKNPTIYYDLFNLSTAERINLGNIDDYRNKIKGIGIDMSKLEVVSEVRNDTANTSTCNVLIPFTDQTKGILKVYNGEVLNFDLSLNKKTVESLKPYNESNETIISNEDYEIIVYDSYIQDFMYQNGKKAQYPSSIDVYVFELATNKINKKNVSVTSAIFIPQGSINTHEALDSSYSSQKVDNIIGRDLKEGETNALFFAITNANGSEESFNGKLQIKFSDNTSIEISTVKE